MQTEAKLALGICAAVILVLVVAFAYIFWPHTRAEVPQTDQQVQSERQPAQKTKAERKALEAEREAERQRAAAQRAEAERTSAEAARARAAAEQEARAEAERANAEAARIRAAAEQDAINKAKLAERGKAYAGYLKKSQEYQDLLLRTSSDLEIGINIRDFNERLRDLNWQYKKWDESLNKEERNFLSARFLSVALMHYRLSLMWWEQKIKSEYTKDLLEVYIQNEWHTAAMALKMAKASIEGNDLLNELPCLMCDGGQCKCVICASKASPDPQCKICQGKGYYTCVWCKGTGKVEQSFVKD